MHVHWQQVRTVGLIAFSFGLCAGGVDQGTELAGLSCACALAAGAHCWIYSFQFLGFWGGCAGWLPELDGISSVCARSLFLYVVGF